jgi:hypothetical protein
VIVVDFGTSTNFDIVGPDGDFVGGVLSPGIETSMEALFSRAARLVKVDYAEPPHVIGKTTEQALRSGLVYGFAGQVDGIVDAIRHELGVEAKAVATGGLADLIAPHSRTVSAVEPFLHPGRVAPDLGAEPGLTAAVHRDREAVEDGLLLGPRQLGLEALDERRRARRGSEQARHDLLRRPQLHELLLERLRKRP